MKFLFLKYHFVEQTQKNVRRVYLISLVFCGFMFYIIKELLIDLLHCFSQEESVQELQHQGTILG
jgi:hypothetical protein